MASRMIPQITFYAMDLRQVDRTWVDSGYGLEAYVFDGEDLERPDFGREFESRLVQVAAMNPSRLTTHFPTDRAEWLRHNRSWRHLLDFCAVSSECGASTVTIHTNLFVDPDGYRSMDSDASLELLLKRLGQIDAQLAGTGTVACIENTPWVGNDGYEFDALLTKPEDFEFLTSAGYKNVSATWDVCHWAQTFTVQSAVDLLARQEPTTFFRYPSRVSQLHFGSFKGVALPGTSNTCVEGVVPAAGDFPVSELARYLDLIPLSAPEVGVVFEVLEEDYTERHACWEALEWYKTNVGRAATHQA